MVEVTLDNTLGAIFLGTVAAAILFGITILQVVLYYHNYPKDWRFQKISVGVLIFLDTIHLGLTVHAVYYYMIEKFGNLKAQEFVVWSYKLQIAVNVVIVVIVHSLYGLRVWKLGRNFGLLLPGLVAIFVLGGYGVGTWLVVETYKINTFKDLHSMSSAVYVVFSTSTFLDVVIATAMCYYLQSSRSSFVGTNNKIWMVMRYVLISGFLTGACSLTALITYAALPNTLIFLGVEFLLTKLHINSYIAMLNARKCMQNQDASSLDMSKFIKGRMGMAGSIIRAGPANYTDVNTTISKDDSMQMLSTAYRNRTDESFTPITKVGGERNTGGSTSPKFDITVHTAEQRHYETMP